MHHHPKLCAPILLCAHNMLNTVVKRVDWGVGVCKIHGVIFVTPMLEADPLGLDDEEASEVPP